MTIIFWVYIEHQKENCFPDYLSKSIRYSKILDISKPELKKVEIILKYTK